MEQLIVETIQPVIGKIIELIILLSQIDVIRILLRAPFENESKVGYTNQASGHCGQVWLRIPAFILFDSNPASEIPIFVWDEFTS